MSCLSISLYIISYHIILYYIISYHTISYHIISYHISWLPCRCVKNQLWALADSARSTSRGRPMSES